MPATPKLESAVLTDQLERAFRGGAWHGPAVTEVLTGVDADTARRAPDGGGHSIFDLVGHIRYCIEQAGTWIANTDEDFGDNPWPAQDDGTEQAWTVELSALEQSHKRLSDAVSSLGDDQLDDAIPNADSTARGLVLGILQHNAYHAGQIMLIVKSAQGGAP